MNARGHGDDNASDVLLGEDRCVLNRVVQNHRKKLFDSVPGERVRQNTLSIRHARARACARACVIYALETCFFCDMITEPGIFTLNKPKKEVLSLQIIFLICIVRFDAKDDGATLRVRFNDVVREPLAVRLYDGRVGGDPEEIR